MDQEASWLQFGGFPGEPDSDHSVWRDRSWMQVPSSAPPTAAQISSSRPHMTQTAVGSVFFRFFLLRPTQPDITAVDEAHWEIRMEERSGMSEPAGRGWMLQERQLQLSCFYCVFTPDSPVDSVRLGTKLTTFVSSPAAVVLFHTALSQTI